MYNKVLGCQATAVFSLISGGAVSVMAVAPWYDSQRHGRLKHTSMGLFSIRLAEHGLGIRNDLRLANVFAACANRSADVAQLGQRGPQLHQFRN